MARFHSVPKDTIRRLQHNNERFGESMLGQEGIEGLRLWLGRRIAIENEPASGVGLKEACFYDFVCGVIADQLSRSN